MTLRLDSLTPRAWAARALEDVPALLSDHAHCELKAAVSAQALVAKNPGLTALVEALPRVAIEELEHFQRVTSILHARGGALVPQDSSPYADGLHRAAGVGRTSLLLDRLLIAHLIEARSLERFHLLSAAAGELGDSELADLYHDLLESEAAHRALFLDLARGAFPHEMVRSRELELRAREGALIAGLAFAHRVHSGWSTPVETEERAC